MKKEIYFIKLKKKQNVLQNRFYEYGMIIYNNVDQKYYL